MNRERTKAVEGHPGVNQDGRAVSEVVAVILLVGVTVILGAVAGSAFLGTANDVEANAGVSVTVDEDEGANEISVRWISGENAEYLLLRVDGGTNPNSTAHWSDNGRLTEIGEGETFDVGGDDNVNLVVIAVDGEKSTVILDSSRQL